MYVITLCTGNSARSVMAGAVIGDRIPGVRVGTRGTAVIEGLPTSWRTRAALERLRLRVDHHRSCQLTADDLDAADVVIAMAREHVEYVRRVHPQAAPRTGTLKRLARDLPTTPGDLTDRVRALRLHDVELEAWEDVEDPAGSEVEQYCSCAEEIVTLLSALVPVLAGDAYADASG